MHTRKTHSTERPSGDRASSNSAENHVLLYNRYPSYSGVNLSRLRVETEVSRSKIAGEAQGLGDDNFQKRETAPQCHDRSHVSRRTATCLPQLMHGSQSDRHELMLGHPIQSRLPCTQPLTTILNSAHIPIEFEFGVNNEATLRSQSYSCRENTYMRCHPQPPGNTNQNPIFLDEASDHSEVVGQYPEPLDLGMSIQTAYRDPQFLSRATKTAH